MQIEWHVDFMGGGGERGTISRGAPEQMLADLFQLGQQCFAAFQSRVKQPGYALAGINIPEIESALQEIEAAYPVELKPGFENTATISGGAWVGEDLLEGGSEDAITKLRFAKGTTDLPVHIHGYSDRVLMPIQGEGIFHTPNEQEGDKEHAIRPGNIVCFSRSLVHTFSAPNKELVLLSWHLPYIPFDDPRQYTIVQEQMLNEPM